MTTAAADARRAVLLSGSMSALAGYVDALGFMSLSGYFVSFMSGNSTQLAISVAYMDGHAVEVALSIIVLFVAGVVIGSLLGQFAASRKSAKLLLAVALLLATSAVLQGVGQTQIAIAAMILAMGMENTTFDKAGNGVTSLTYVTGTLVKLGQATAARLMGGAPAGGLRLFSLWLGLVGGAVLGGLTYQWMGLHGLWIASGLAALLSLAAAVIRPGETKEA
ncbi:uncharacterized membrane protein YoaK (UPF0700 family) [Rhodoligotrophos appendicifer]|uniref:YoaK family protein n=1 Tax=Rhodoligotrophos appendicifer TaxID=987056 RepID=UPI001184ED6C|nr:YoaK family protein [Rhodoligotrophos appendicifer]